MRADQRDARDAERAEGHRERERGCRRHDAGAVQDRVRQRAVVNQAYHRPLAGSQDDGSGPRVGKKVSRSQQRVEVMPVWRRVGRTPLREAGEHRGDSEATKYLHRDRLHHRIGGGQHNAEKLGRREFRRVGGKRHLGHYRPLRSVWQRRRRTVRLRATAAVPRPSAAPTARPDDELPGPLRSAETTGGTRSRAGDGTQRSPAPPPPSPPWPAEPRHNPNVSRKRSIRCMRSCRMVTMPMFPSAKRRQ